MKAQNIEHEEACSRGKAMSSSTAGFRLCVRDEAERLNERALTT